MDWYEQVMRYTPTCEQEEVDKGLLLEFATRFPDVLTRNNWFGHMTATAMIVNPARDKFVIVHHGVYGDWTIPGGHADGEEDLLVVAMNEAAEETGLTPRVLNSGEPLGLQALPTRSHMHRARGYVPAHTHYDVTFAFEASEAARLVCPPDELMGVKWLDAQQADSEMVVDFMRPVQAKLLAKVRELGL